MANHVSDPHSIHENSARPAVNVRATPVSDVARPRPMPFAYIARDEVSKFIAGVIDPRTKRKVPGSVRAMYLVAYLSIPTSGAEAAKPENQRVITEARSKFARDSGFSERSIQRGYKTLERLALLKFEPGGRAGPANVHTREWQRFTLPKAPVGHWRVMVPRAERKRREIAEKLKAKRAQLILERLGRVDTDGSRVGLATQKIDARASTPELSPTETKRLPLPIPGDGVSASPRQKDERGGAPPRNPPADADRRHAGALPRELPPDVAAERARDWNDKLARAQRRAAGLPDPDPDPKPH